MPAQGIVSGSCQALNERLLTMGVVVLLAFTLLPVFAADDATGLQGRTLYRLQVDGMVCPFCAYNVEQRLQGLSGVEYVDVDVESGRVMVGLRPGERLKEAQVRKLMEGAGFRLQGLEQRPLTREELRGPE